MPVKTQKNSTKLDKLENEIAKLKKEIEDREWASKKTNEGIKILYKELEEKNKKLERLDQIKSHFVANVSHEFKNPLAIINECISLVFEGVVGGINQQQRETLARAKKTVERLLRLVMDLLDLSRIESGKMTLKKEDINVASVLEEVVSVYEGELSRKNITLKKHIAPEAGVILADRDKISEVMINLLNNAIKYAPERGTIDIRLTGDNKGISFEISDDGPGIPKKYHTKIFDKFERITAEKQEGTGLGLPIARDIVKLHKGRLWVESKPGKGSKFIFTLPRTERRHAFGCTGAKK
ncbi:MAG: ATP-binding protein [Omnitrophica bacterium]|nr:ATP-binding protein [Candidatus Omnitrophota bacterium]